MKKIVFVLMLALAAAIPAAKATEYSTEAIRFANSPGDSVADMVMGAPEDYLPGNKKINLTPFCLVHCGVVARTRSITPASPIQSAVVILSNALHRGL